MEQHVLNMANVQHVAQVYDAEAPQYDGDYSDPTTLACDALVMERIREVLQSFSTSTNRPVRILDVGCGTGIVPRSIPELQGNRFQYSGIDVSEGMLAEARRHLPTNVDLRQADMHDAQFIEDTSIDALLSIYGPFSYSLEPERLIEEFARTVRPDGRIILMPYSVRLGAGVLTGFSTAYSEETQKLFYTKETITKLLQESGYFTEVRVIGINYLGYFHGALEGGQQNEQDVSSLHAERKLLRRLRQSMQSLGQEIPVRQVLNRDQETARAFLPLSEREGFSINESAPGIDYIRREAQLAELLGVEPGMARFMLVQATRTQKPVERE